MRAAREIAKRIAVDSNGERSRVALSVSDPESFCALFLALGRSGIDLFFFNPKWGERERTEALAIAKPQWEFGLFSGDRFAESRTEDSADSADSAEQIEPGLRVMIPTGGTSGKLKFAIHRWSTLSASAYGVQAFFGAGQIASHCMLPLYHVSGFMQLIRSVLSVGKIAFGSVDEFAVTHDALFAGGDRDRFLSVVATQLDRLLRVESNLPFLRKYEAIFVGGGPVSNDLLEAAREARLPLAPTYGMSETAAQVATLKPDEFLADKAMQGKALPHVRLDIVGNSGELLPIGKIGRIQVKATSLFRGYIGQAEHRVGSIVTSDLGSLSESGRLTVIGRSDNVIISGGEKIDLGEVENLLEKTGLVTDVAAFGIEDAEWGSKLGVAYVLKDEADPEPAMRAAVAAELVGFKMPKVWLAMKGLPRNEAGKVLRDRLAEQAKQKA